MSDTLPCRPRRILLLDPDRRTTSRLAGLLVDDGFEVEMLADGVSAIARLGGQPAFEALVTELNLPRAAATEVVQFAVERWPALRIVLLTRYPNLVEAARLGGSPSVLPKPLDYARLLELLTGAPAEGGRRAARLLAGVGGC